MSKHVLASAALYGVVAWVVFIGLIAVVLRWSDVLLPWAVSVSLVAGGVVLVRDSRSTGDGERAAWFGLGVLIVAALAVLGVF